MTHPRTRNACTDAEMQVTQTDRAGSLSQPPAPHSHDPGKEDRGMPTTAHIAQDESARNSQNANHWQPLADVCSRVVASASRQIGGGQ